MNRQFFKKEKQMFNKYMESAQTPKFEKESIN